MPLVLVLLPVTFGFVVLMGSLVASIARGVAVRRDRHTQLIEKLDELIRLSKKGHS